MARRYSEELERRLTTTDAGRHRSGRDDRWQGCSPRPAPAAAAAGTWLLAGLALPALVAYANVTSSAQLAALYPEAAGAA